MSFYDTCTELMHADLDARMASVTETDVRRALAAHKPTAWDLLAMLSPAASPILEAMAEKGSRLTLQHFGRTIHLFTPLYLSNFCTNHCVYCGFNTKNRIPRSQLTLDQVEAEAKAISAMGLKNLLILTGDCRAKAGPDYLHDCVTVLRKYFPSVSIEIYAMEEDEYRALVVDGVDGMTMFQETYDEALYPSLHPKGPKSDFRFRLDAPERACKAGMRVVNIGALLGLSDWRKDAFLTGMHAAYLMDRYPETDIASSLPRMRPHAGEYQPATVVSDRDLVQVMLALRIFLPRLGITHLHARGPGVPREHPAPGRDPDVRRGVHGRRRPRGQGRGRRQRGPVRDQRRPQRGRDVRRAPRPRLPARVQGLAPPGRDGEGGRMNAAEQGMAAYLGEERLAFLQTVTVGIAGAGGLGSNCAMHLVRSGFKRFVIADFDRVEPSNLNRQAFRLDQVGEKKVAALAENMRGVNPGRGGGDARAAPDPGQRGRRVCPVRRAGRGVGRPPGQGHADRGVRACGRASGGRIGHGRGRERGRDRHPEGAGEVFTVVGDMATECGGENPPFSAPRGRGGRQAGGRGPGPFPG